MRSRPSPNACRPPSRAVLLVVVIAIALGVAGCSSLPGFGDAGGEEDEQPREYIYEARDDWIALSPAVGAERPNAHPVSLSASDLRASLAGLEAEFDESRGRGLFSGRGGDRVPVFTPATLDEIVEPLVEAFARADQDQDVLLRVSQIRKGELIGFLTRRVITTARLFHRDDGLHIIMGSLDFEPERAASTDPRNTPKSGSYRSPGARAGNDLPMGSRTESSPIEARLRAEHSVAGAPAGRDDWLVLGAGGATGSTDAASESGGSGPGGDVAADPEPEASELGEDQAADAVPAESVTERQALESLDEETLDRLRELRELRRQDLISEQAYESMVRDLLGLSPGEPR